MAGAKLRITAPPASADDALPRCFPLRISRRVPRARALQHAALANGSISSDDTVRVGHNPAGQERVQHAGVNSEPAPCRGDKQFRGQLKRPCWSPLPYFPHLPPRSRRPDARTVGKPAGLPAGHISCDATAIEGREQGRRATSTGHAEVQARASTQE